MKRPTKSDAGTHILGVIDPFFVGGVEVSAVCLSDVANHPQSLWISLWAAFRHRLQVTYRKGFFFDRSNFERSVFGLFDQRVTMVFPIAADFL
jgi:hypothetical protein